MPIRIGRIIVAVGLAAAGFVGSTICGPVLLAGSATATAVALSAGSNHTCALLSTKTVMCWGYNGEGELGNGTIISSSLPVVVRGLTGATSVSAGFNYTCALLSTKTVKCWGYNGEGDLGNGSTNDSSVPVAVKDLTGVTAIASGGWQTCALLSTGTVKCWGYNALGDLGDGTFTGPSLCLGIFPCSTTPVAVKSLTGVTAIASGSGWHSCARLSTGTVKCWGDNEYGELGNGRTGAKFDSSVPVAVKGLTGVTSVFALGSIHSCALLITKTVKCWGYNASGELGTGTTLSSSIPAAVKGLSGVSSISAGDIHTCALQTTATVVCWGDNSFGELGSGSTTGPSSCSGSPCSKTPVAVKGLTGVTAIAAGGEHSCALLSTKTVDCWGYNRDGELGNGTTTDSSIPVAVAGL